ncbi:hypothetical protein BdWA1_002843, partial [Babesia duncani]
TTTNSQDITSDANSGNETNITFLLTAAQDLLKTIDKIVQEDISMNGHENKVSPLSAT